jgi:hypothetical protein
MHSPKACSRELWTATGATVVALAVAAPGCATARTEGASQARPDAIAGSGVSGGGVIFVLRREGRATITVSPYARLETLDRLRSGSLRLRCAFGGQVGRQRDVRTADRVTFRGRAATVVTRPAGRTDDPPHCALVGTGAGGPAVAQAVLFPPATWGTVAVAASPAEPDDVRLTIEARGVATDYEGGIRARISYNQGTWPGGMAPTQLFCRIPWLTDSDLTARLDLPPRGSEVVVGLQRRRGIGAISLPQSSGCELSRRSFGSVLQLLVRPLVVVR